MLKTILLSLAAVTLFSVSLSAQGRGKAPARPLPEGPGKAIVETACTSCHPAAMVTSTGHTPEEWKLVVERMVEAGAEVPSNQVDELEAYLAKSFPEGDVARAVIIPGPVKITFKEFKAPTPGSRPHDPLATRDGYLWYSGMYANVLGRIDTKTGDIKEFRPPIAHSGPHGLVEDKDGKIWFTANTKGYIGTLDPKNGEFSEHKLPPEVRDPHTPLFDRDGILWFTAQGANKISRLDPKTGDLKVVDSPTPRSNPYGMVLDSTNTMWYCEFNSNKIARIDSKTMAIKEYTLPDPDARPRRIAITPDDMIYYGDYARGYLGRLNTKTGEVKEWPSPGGPRSQPYGITFLNGVVWYSEAAVKPNTMVRFDPKTEKFQTWAIPAGGGVVRNMMVTKDGNIAIAESGMNVIGLVEIGK